MHTFIPMNLSVCKLSKVFCHMKFYHHFCLPVEVCPDPRVVLLYESPTVSSKGYNDMKHFFRGNNMSIQTYIRNVIKKYGE